jgi:diguanylate cyclase (GGDEF)-like protein
MSDFAHPSLEIVLPAIWEKHRATSLERVSVIERAVRELAAGGLGDPLRGEAQRAAHMLAGSVGTFGFTRASGAAHDLELELATPVPARAPVLAQLVSATRRDLEGELVVPVQIPSGELGGGPPRMLLVGEDGEDDKRERLSAARVLIVDDDPLVCDMMREVLGRHDLEISTLADPLRLWETLGEVAPELLILDVDMPGLNGPELCRQIRGDARWSGLALIFVTPVGNPAMIEELFRVGADDYVAKPIVGTELLTRVSNRLDRIRLYRAQAETDSLTGLPNRAKSSEDLRRLATLAERFSQPLSIAMLDLDRFKGVNDNHGHAAGDSVLRALGERLRRDFRGNDIVGRWGGEEFVVGMYGMAREDAVRRLMDTLGRLREERFTGSRTTFQASFSAGVAEYPLDGHDIVAVLAAADQSLYDAKAAGRAHVQSTSGRVTRPRSP